jgi:hypothetical protein
MISSVQAASCFCEKEPALVSGPQELVDQSRRRGEADREALLTGGEPEPQGDVGLARARRSQGNHVLPRLDIRTARQLQDQQLVQRRERGEVEAVQALGRREARPADAPLDQPPFALQQLEFGQAQEVAGVVDALGGALPGELVVLAQEGRQPERLEVVPEQDLRRRAHGAAPLPSSAR